MRAPREPDFANLLAVLQRKAPSRPTLFEFILCEALFPHYDIAPPPPDDPKAQLQAWIELFAAAGYDFAVVHPAWPPFIHFSLGDQAEMESYSANEGGVVKDWDDLDQLTWPEVNEQAFEIIDELASELPDGMKFVVPANCGVLENLIKVVGFEDLCLLTLEDPELVQAVTDEVGRRLVRHYELALACESVGAIIQNDDWGYRTQTMLSPADLRRYIFPWHKRMASMAHQCGRPVILHSCGNLDEVWDDVVDDIQADGKHSYEDAICPVEDAYERLHPRLAVLGGLDMDYVCRSRPEEVYRRARSMVERSAQRGGYAVGTGNSVPDYVPIENYRAMLNAALDG
ncbi:MAG: uroporphyrinogen decarboxylase family protein [Opitutales bacterium]